MAANDPIEAPPPPRRRRGDRLLRRLLGRLLLLLLVAIGISIYFRIDLINRLAPDLISKELGVPADFSVQILDWRQARIDRLRLGRTGALTIEGVLLSYDPWNRHLERVEIERVALSADYDSGFSFGDLDPLIARLRGSDTADATTPQSPTAPSPESDTSLPQLPTIIVKAIEVDLRSPAGLLKGSGQATLDNQAIVAEFSLSESNGHAEIDANIALSLAEDGAPPSGALQMRLEAESAAWDFVGVPAPANGRLTLDAQLRTDAAWQQSRRVEAEWRLEAVDFAHAFLPSPLSGTLLAKSSVDEAGAAISGIAADFLGGIAPDWKTTAGGNLALRFDGDAADITGKLALTGTGETLALAPLGAGDITLAKPDVTLTADITGKLAEDGTATLNLQLAEPARIKTAKLDIGDTLRLPQATNLTLRPGDTPLLQLTRDAAGHMVSDVTATLDKSSLTLEPTALGERLIVTMPSTRLEMHHDSAPVETAAPAVSVLAARLVTRGAQIVLPARGITLAGVALDASHDGRSSKAAFSSSAVAGLGAFVPVRAEADATLSGDNATFKARFRGVDQPIDLSLNGKANIANQRGEVTLKLAPIDFAVGGLQPYNLFPPLRSYAEDVSGRIEAAGPIRFEGSKLSSALKLGVENFSGKVGPVQVLNVNTVIEIDRPWPLSTKPDQAIAIARADIGLALTDALFRFKISDGRRLDVAESHLQMSGGEVRMDPISLDIEAPVHNVKLTVSKVAVSELFASLGIAGLSGDGSISGVLPVSIFPGGIAIPAAELKADAPGVLRYDRNRAPLALQSAGESVAMALQALSDFHYKDLILTLTRELTGDVNLGLHISGSNPSFYDGYPVEFNLSVEGRLDEALRQGLAGYRVPDMIQEQLENLAP